MNGQVTDRDGLPIEGVRVYFANGNSPHSAGGGATTDAFGMFEFDSLPDNPPFSFHKEGYSEIANRNLPIDGDGLVTVQMFPPGVILGSVVDSTTGKPILARSTSRSISRRNLSPESRPPAFDRT